MEIILSIALVLALVVILIQKDTVREVKRDHEILFKQYSEEHRKRLELERQETDLNHIINNLKGGL